MQNLKISEGNTLMYIMILMSSLLISYGIYIVHCRVNKLESQQILFEKHNSEIKSQLEEVQNNMNELPKIQEITEETTETS